ncbi:AAA family ATPase [Haloarcula onubensis]|uniref:AAA family ATPase n=1 Tax=Haloarcula onubensis TaxID=2950539 RepID=A0ABU2FTG7_9EURY|nr:AAA family ATPase [Halomicroarcula sp. S3CR25-11]MDS0284045.1 AAA family ATPase [Halomicroarcula sp. S3CR25-11]
MELEKLTLHNFRQFYGEQELVFSGDTEKNVTVIHGSNGSGKTTVLNSFLWLFYGDVKLPKPDQIASERAMAEAGLQGTVEVEVQLEFSHDGTEYTAKRSKTVRRNGENDFAGTEVTSDLHLEFLDETGNRKVRGNAEDSLRQIMPERLREIFFFDGETIDELSEIGGQEKIQTAIQNIMGLTILERAKRHLESVRKGFEEEVSRHGSEELSELYQKRTDLEDRIDALSDDLSDAKDSKEKTKSELTDVKQRLNELEDSQELQQERERLEGDVEGLKEEIEQINDQLSNTISNKGYVPFAGSAVEKTAKMLQQKREQGEIPSEIKTQFVDDLLEMEECICGRELVPETEPYRNVSKWRESAGSSELEEAAMNIAGQLTEIGEDEEEIYETLKDLLKQRSDVGDEIQRKEERISEISGKLEGIDTENINQLERRRKDLESKLTEYDQQIGSVQGKIESVESDLEEVKQEINEAEEQNKKADLARRRAQMAEYLQNRIEELFEKYQDEVRKSVNERVNDIFRDIIVKDYYAEIDDDYSLRILKDIGSNETIPVAKSTGERQIASLSFIASLVSLARERYHSDEESIYFSGGIYPMIMDSPFGYLDPEYQKRVSSVLPEMAEQVVVLVTQSQWTQEVAGEMDAIAGERYRLEYHDPADDPTTEYEYTELVRQHQGAR